MGPCAWTARPLDTTLRRPRMERLTPAGSCTSRGEAVRALPRPVRLSSRRTGPEALSTQPPAHARARRVLRRDGLLGALEGQPGLLEQVGADELDGWHHELGLPIKPRFLQLQPSAHGVRPAPPTAPPSLVFKKYAPRMWTQDHRFSKSTHRVCRYRYCDGNSFSANRDEPITVNGDKIFFRGKRIIDAVIK